MVIYLETSVPSGWGREVFDAPLNVFYDDICDSGCTVIVPQHTLDELEDKKTPDEVFEKLNTIKYLVVETPPGAKELADLYVERQIIPSGYGGDALHLAIATILEVDVLVSWNLTHIMNENSIPRINKVNKEKGYKPVTVIRPEEIKQWLKKLS
jgi:hypothetical protein